MRWQRRIKRLLCSIYTVQLRLRKTSLTMKPGALLGFNTKISIGNGGRFVIGENSFCGADTTILSNSIVEIGSNTCINGGGKLGSARSIRIGQGVMIAHNVTIYDNNNHPVDFNSRKKIACGGYTPELLSWEASVKKPIEIKDYVWVGMQSIILKGVTIGRGAIVAAGSVVVHDVPEMTVVGGNPAQILKKVA